MAVHVYSHMHVCTHVYCVRAHTVLHVCVVCFLFMSHNVYTISIPLCGQIKMPCCDIS